MSEAVVTYEETMAALAMFREWEGIASDIDGMWAVLKADREAQAARVVAEEPQAPRQSGLVFVPQPIQPPRRPPVSPQEYPLGTVWMSGDGSAWEVEWDDQDKRHMWVPVKQEGS